MKPRARKTQCLCARGKCGGSNLRALSQPSDAKIVYTAVHKVHRKEQ
jgi:hypothetical protein